MIMEPWMTISRWILLFAIYSILGWCYEVVLDFVVRQKLVNRGFLMGPYCPHLWLWRRAGAAAFL